MAYAKKLKPKQPTKQGKKPFADILLCPIEKPDRIILMAAAKGKSEIIEELAELADDWVQQQRIERFEALSHHYGVVSKDFNTTVFRLLMHVTKDFIVGFQFTVEQPPSAGRARGKTTTGGFDLVIAVDNYVRSTQEARTKAFQYLVSRASKSRWTGKTPAALKRAYNDEIKTLRISSAEFRTHPFYSEMMKYADFRNAEDQGTKT